MARRRSQKTRPFVQLDAKLLKNYMPIIGPNGLAVYTSLKLHENRRTGQCNPSYQTIANETGLSRPTVIKYAQQLSLLKLIKIVPIWTSVSDRSSNQYVMADPGIVDYPKAEPIPTPDDPGTSGKAGLLPLTDNGNSVDYPSQNALPNPDPLNQIYITKDKTPEKSTVSKQKTCPHPAVDVSHLGQDINICNHCFGLLNDNGELVEESLPVENVA